MDAEQLERLSRLLAEATPSEERVAERLREDTHYAVLGVPCGIPIATFGEPVDALLFVEMKRALPALISTAKRVEALEEENARLKDRLANSIQFAGGRSPIAPQPSGSARATLTQEP
jgi:hypothetical protein